MKRFKSYINESVELDESITKMSDARLKFHVLKNVPHGSYTKKELSAEHDRRKKTGGAEYNAVKPSLNEENIDEAVNAKKIAADHDAGHSIDVIVQKHLNKKGDNKDEILKAIQAHRWNKRMKKEEAEQIDELKKSTLGSYVKKSADDLTHIQRDITSGGTQDPEYKGLSRMRKNRKAGIARAVTSLTKEEAELDEVSQETLRNYHAKAALDLRKKREKLDKGTLTSKDYKQGQNRVTGLNRAANKMEEVELDEARKSDSYQFTHKPGDAESEKRLADLKKSVKGTGKRVVLQGRLGKDNPNAHKYSKDAPWGKYKDGKRVNSDVSGKSGGHSHQRIQKADAAHHDVYVYDRNESVELDELKKSTLGSYIKKANVDAMKHAQKSGEYNNPDQPKHFSKAMDRMRGVKKATDKLTKEEVEQIDEISKATLRKVGGQMLRKGLSDDPKAAKHLKYANMASAKLYPNQYKNSPLKAKVNATEEVESLDELSKKTLASYVKKAAGVGDRNSLPNAMRDQMTAANMGDKEWYKDSQRKANKRGMGIQRAADRLAKEEADLEEKLVGGQKKLDHNKNGKIDSHDFHLMRKKKMKEEVEGLDEISRDLARRYIRKIADKTNTGELSVKQVEKRRPGLNLAGKKAYPSIAGEPKVRATD
jgi:chemotaxis receptor (MCP) glutamine deamidase CheD